MSLFVGLLVVMVCMVVVVFNGVWLSFVVLFCGVVLRGVFCFVRFLGVRGVFGLWSRGGIRFLGLVVLSFESGFFVGDGLLKGIVVLLVLWKSDGEVRLGV